MTSAFASGLKDPGLFVEKAFIDWQWVASQSNVTFNVCNPASEALVGTCPESNTEDLNDAIQAAARAFPTWRSVSGRQRGRILRRWADLLLDNKEDIGRIITAENGKAKADAEGEAVFAASFFEWFAEEAPRIYGDVVPHSSPTSRTQVLKEPVGVCGLITPWNFPIAMGARKVAAALAAGCTIVLKSGGLMPFASNVMATLGEQAGVPNGVFNVVTALTNTPSLGRLLCETEISSHTLRKVSLELGGNAPFIVFDDAGVEAAVASALISKFKRLVQEVQKYKIGNGLEDASVTHGPLTNGVAKVSQHIHDALDKKATVLLGGNRLPALGANFHELTILGDVDDSMQVTREETFGPLAALARFSTEDEVVRRANDCDVGLVSYLMTSDLARAHRVSERLEACMVAINTGVVPDAAAPFGGVKYSGMGREGSKYGVEEYLNVKMIVTGGINTAHTAHL
ncbi:NAD-dependent succinate-semialdehyde dehydrogenase [Aspergillus melleus]|uniref:NAD-dependent succinate-semialdehyde dehydrogenase n=1 Tax=Aspergillus melleus TaxID=138277 RepID=UPI001E8D6103|nr:uncharacterized protein LDX57_010943 [Aspergillus melleus]KAH8433307.1 hypothetical protein LDX57_010943 [Aspergillus melleus]